jgi:hypothetical protein
MADEVERRLQERRQGGERRAPSRLDPLSRRAQLRRQTDVISHLSATTEKTEALTKDLPCLDSTPLLF